LNMSEYNRASLLAGLLFNLLLQPLANS